MKAIPTRLIAWNKWGHKVYEGKYPSIREAKRNAREMVDCEFAHSYRLFKLPRSQATPVV
jgi:hypothetical protein